MLSLQCSIWGQVPTCGPTTDYAPTVTTLVGVVIPTLLLLLSYCIALGLTKDREQVTLLETGAFPYLICVCVLQTQIEKKR